MTRRPHAEARVFRSFSDQARADREYWRTRSPGECLDMMWQLTLDAWAFTGERVITKVDGVDFERAWTNRADVDIEGLRIPVIGRQELIANKRSVGRPQDLVDADLLESPDALL